MVLDSLSAIVSGVALSSLASFFSERASLNPAAKSEPNPLTALPAFEFAILEATSLVFSTAVEVVFDTHCPNLEFAIFSPIDFIPETRLFVADLILSLTHLSPSFIYPTPVLSFFLIFASVVDSDFPPRSVPVFFTEEISSISATGKAPASTH